MTPVSAPNGSSRQLGADELAMTNSRAISPRRHALGSFQGRWRKADFFL